MISNLRDHRRAGWAPAARVWLGVGVIAALAAGCSKVPLVAPANTTITLYSNAQVVPVNGTAQITASVLESGGNPVQDGTRVTFTTSLGTLSPAEAETADSKVTVSLLAGMLSGTAEVNAFSGSNAAKATIKILIGAAAATSITMAAVPATVPATGGSSVVTATVFDTNGNTLPGVPVSFSADVGTLVPSSATSDVNGQAVTRVTTNQTATITAAAGPKITATAKVTATAAPTVTIAGPSATPTVGLSNNFTVTVQAGTNAAPIREVVVDFGDGSWPVELGAATGTILVPHVYLSTGTFLATATATDAMGQTTSVSVPVNVFAAVPFTLTVTAPSGKSGVPVTFNAVPGAGAPAIVSYKWEFGDGSSAVTTTGSVPHTYTVTGTGTVPPQQFVVTVTATGVDGRIGVGSVVVVITP